MLKIGICDDDMITLKKKNKLFPTILITEKLMQILLHTITLLI